MSNIRKQITKQNNYIDSYRNIDTNQNIDNKFNVLRKRPFNLKGGGEWYVLKKKKYSDFQCC